MILPPTDENIVTASKLLKEGGVVAIPTETVYGLAASIKSEAGLREIFRIKKRPSDNPLIVHVSSIEQALSLCARPLLKQLEQLAGAFWPGPLTIVVPYRGRLSSLITAGLRTVALRMPDHDTALTLISMLSSPLAAPSANRSGRPSPTTAEHVEKDLGPQVMILDGGPCRVGIESTVVRLSKDTLTLLRPGAISRSTVFERTAMQVVDLQSQADRLQSPGTRYRHYAPIAQVVLVVDIGELNRQKEAAQGIPIAVLASPTAQILHQIEGSRPLTTQTLYSEFRRADDLQLERILVLCDETTAADEALMNRLSKAAEPLSGLDDEQ